MEHPLQQGFISEFPVVSYIIQLYKLFPFCILSAAMALVGCFEIQRCRDTKGDGANEITQPSAALRHRNKWKKGKIRKSWQQLTKIVKISNENYDSGDDFSERALIRVPFSCACSHPI